MLRETELDLIITERMVRLLFEKEDGTLQIELLELQTPHRVDIIIDIPLETP